MTPLVRSKRDRRHPSRFFNHFTQEFPEAGLPQRNSRAAHQGEGNSAIWLSEPRIGDEAHYGKKQALKLRSKERPRLRDLILHAFFHHVMVVVVMIVAARFHATVHVAMMHAFVHSFFHHRPIFSDSGRRNCDRSQCRQDVRNLLHRFLLEVKQPLWNENLNNPFL